MNTENNNLPEDEQLSSLYKDIEQEVPASHLDDAILAAARRETTSRPRPAYSPFSNNWRVPVSLAAVLVLSIGLVNLMENQPLVTNGIAPLSIEEQMLQDEIVLSDGIAIADNQPSIAMERAKPAKTLAEPDLRASKPAFRSPKAKTTRKRQQETFAASAEPSIDVSTIESGVASGDRLDHIPSITDILTRRLAGNIEQANHMADTFIHHYFGNNLENVIPEKVKLAPNDWKALIIELRALGRVQEADKLEALMKSTKK